MSSAATSWPAPLARWRWAGAQLLRAEASEDEQPGNDSLGTPGRVRTRRTTARARDLRSASVIRELLEGAGLRVVASETERIDLSSPPADLAGAHLDPFSLERRVEATVRGRAFPGGQRAVVEAKVAALRRETADPSVPEARRATAAQMLLRLEEGLDTTVDLRATERRFAPSVGVTSPRESIGATIPLRVGSRLVHRVRPREGTAHADDEAGTLAFHVVGIGASEAAVVFAGEVHGFRHLLDLEGSRVHDAWFINRERSRTDATAPWLGRAVFRELRSSGRAELVVARRRDAVPVGIVVVSEEKVSLRVDGAPREVPVLRCLTSRDDEIDVLDDAESPLVLRISETGIDLVRAVDDVLGPPSE